MSLLLETNLGGDIVIDLDVEGSPQLCLNVLKLAKARYYTSTLVYNVEPNRYCQLGDPQGTGRGGECIYGLLDPNQKYLKASGRTLSETELQERGRVVAVEMGDDWIGSQFCISLTKGSEMALHGMPKTKFFSIGQVVEGWDVLDQIQNSFIDPQGRPYADIRIVRAFIVEDPFDDPPGMDQLMKQRGIVVVQSKETNNGTTVITDSPNYKEERPPEEVVEHRIAANQVDWDEASDEELALEQQSKRQEQIMERQDKSRAVVLEMLGDLPSADIQAPDNVLFVCKLNPITQDEDLELIFSRFDSSVKAEIIRDPISGDSLQYAFVEFTNKQQCVEAYFKMNNALVDDRRIKVDFSQSVAKVWDRYNQKARMPRNVQTNRDGGRGGGRGQRQGRDGQRFHRNNPGRGDGLDHNNNGRRGRHDEFRRHDLHNDRHHHVDEHGPARRRYNTNHDNNHREHSDNHTSRRVSSSRDERRRRRSRSRSPPLSDRESSHRRRRRRRRSRSRSPSRSPSRRHHHHHHHQRRHDEDEGSSSRKHHRHHDEDRYREDESRHNKRQRRHDDRKSHDGRHDDERKHSKKHKKKARKRSPSRS